MNLIRLICLLLICCFLGAAQELPAIPEEHPEQIGGRWETVTPSGIEGIGLEIMSASKGPLGSEGEHFLMQHMSIRVYTRQGGQEKWGYFLAQFREKSKSYNDILLDGHSFDVFDGRHLRIHFTDTTDINPFDLDIVFVPKANKWIGTWSRGGKDESVTLTRPAANIGVGTNKFVGEWIGEPSPNNATVSTTLNIRQSSDGVLSVSLDRTSSAISLSSSVTHNERRNGEQLNIESISDSTIVLKTNGSSGARYEFNGTLSADGQVLVGCWGAPDGCGRLGAADRFRRAPLTPPQSSGR